MKLFFENNINHGVQKVFKSENNQYGASVVKHIYSYGGNRGLWELAVIEFKGEQFELTYDTPITDDVIGYLEWSEVEKLLEQIDRLEEAQ